MSQTTSKLILLLSNGFTQLDTSATSGHECFWFGRRHGVRVYEPEKNNGGLYLDRWIYSSQ